MDVTRQDLSESAILACIDRHFENERPGIGLGRGDDCAIVWPSSDLCVSSDLFMEDIHFRHAYFQPDEIGHKALAVNISDLAAMAAKPLAFLLNIGLPANMEMQWLDEFFGGMSALAKDYNMSLIGGDIAASDKLHISITAIGQKTDGCSLLRRGGIMTGDTLFLIGAIGLARIGLMEMEAWGRKAMLQWPESCSAHLMPRPHVNTALMLGRAGFNARPPGLMDVSDGILADLPRLLGHERGSNLGAELVISPSILHDEVIRHAELHEADPVLEAIRGAEDYALLGACAPDMIPILKSAIPGLVPIGKIVMGGRIICNGVDITGLKGFDHFS